MPYNVLEDISGYQDGTYPGSVDFKYPYYHINIIGHSESFENPNAIDEYIEVSVEYSELTSTGAVVWNSLSDSTDTPYGATDTQEGDLTWMKIPVGDNRTVAIPPTMPSSDPNETDNVSLRVPTQAETWNYPSSYYSYGSIRVRTRYTDDLASVSLASMTPHVWVGSPNASPWYCYTEEMYFDNILAMESLGAIDLDITQILPLQSLGKRYAVSPSMPGRRQISPFAVCVLAVDPEATTTIRISRPAGMPVNDWIDVLTANGVQWSTNPPEHYSIDLEYGQTYTVADYVDKYNEYFTDPEHPANSDSATTTGRFVTSTASSAYGGILIESSTNPFAIFTVEHQARAETDRTGVDLNDIVVPSNSDFVLDQPIPYEASGEQSEYYIPICPPFASTGHNVRIMAYEPGVNVEVIRRDYGQPNNATPIIHWQSTNSAMAIDLDVVSIKEPSLVASNALPIGTDETIYIKSTKPVSIVISPRGDVLNGNAGGGQHSDPDMAANPHGGTLAVSARVDVAAYAMSVPPITQYATECTWTIPTLYETNTLACGALYNSPFCPPPLGGGSALLAQQGQYMRNYVVVIARADICEDVMITYDAYSESGGYVVEPFTTYLHSMPFDSISQVNEGVASWREKSHTETARLTEWEPYGGHSVYKWCLLQIGFATEYINLRTCNYEEARRTPQAGLYRVFVEPSIVDNLPAGDSANLIGAFPIGIRNSDGSTEGTADEPVAYGFSAVPIRLPIQQVIIEEELLEDDYRTLLNRTAHSEYTGGLDGYPDAPIARWTIATDVLPQSQGETLEIEYQLHLDNNLPSTLRQMSESTTLRMPGLGIVRTRGADYLPVLADPWGLEITTDSASYPQDVTAIVTSTISPTPVSKREVFDEHEDFVTPASHILNGVLIDSLSIPDNYAYSPPDIAVLELSGSNQFEDGRLSIVADAGHPVRWKDLRLVMTSPIDSSGTSVAQSVAGVSVDIGMRSAPTIAALEQMRQDPESLIPIQSGLTENGEFLIDETTAFNLPVSQYLEIVVDMHPGTDGDYSPAIEAIYVAHHPAALTLSMQIEELPVSSGQQGELVENLGSFPLNNADLNLSEVVRTAEFDTGSVPTGQYIARAFVRDGLSGEQLATATTEFTINPDVPPTALGDVSVEPSIYDTDDSGTIASMVDNPNAFTSFEDVSVDVTATRSGAPSPSLEYTYLIDRLDPGIEHIEPINLLADSSFPAGMYTVLQEINVGSPLIGTITNTTTFEVRSSTSRLAGIEGTLTIENSTIDPDGDPMVSVWLKNTGNEDLTNVRYRFVFPYPTGSPVDDVNHTPFELVLVGPSAFDIGDEFTAQIPRGVYVSEDNNPANGIVPTDGYAYPIQLSATSLQHDAVTAPDEGWIPIDAGAFLVFSDPLQVSPRRYIPIVLGPVGESLASTGFGINIHGEAVGTSSGDPELVADQTATVWSLSRNPIDLHTDVLSGLELSISTEASSTALNVNRDGYVVGQLTGSEWTRSFISEAFGSYFHELQPSPSNSTLADAFVTDISDEASPTAVGYEISSVQIGGIAGDLAMNDPGLIGSGAGSGELMSGSLETGSEVTATPTQGGGTSLLGPGGAPGIATALIPRAITWPSADSSPLRATLLDLAAVGTQAESTVQGSRIWAVEASGDIAGDWYNDALELSGFRSYHGSLIDAGQYLDRDTTLRAIGNSGRTSGWSGLGIDQKSFQVKINGSKSELVPSPSGAPDQHAHAINGNGEAVGSSGAGDDQAVAAWDNSTFHDPYESFTAQPRTPWKLLEMRDVNDSGQMIGTAEIPRVLLGKGWDVETPGGTVQLPIPEPIDVGSFFADSEGSGQVELESYSTDYIAFTSDGTGAYPIGINTYFGGILRYESTQLRASEIFGEIYYLPDGATQFTITPVMDAGYGKRTVGVVRLSQITTDPVVDPIRWAVEAVSNTVVLVHEHDSQAPGYWTELAAFTGDNPPLTTGGNPPVPIDYRHPFIYQLVGDLAWMATEPFALVVMPNNTREAFLADAGSIPEEYEQNLRGNGWYPGPPVPTGGGNVVTRPPMFSVTAANPDQKDQMLSFNGFRVAGSEIATMTFVTFELIARNAENGNIVGSNRDFNDLMITFEPALVPAEERHQRAILLDPVRFDIDLLDRLRLWARSDVGVVPAFPESVTEGSEISRWWDFGTWQHHFGVVGNPTKDISGGERAHPGIHLDGGLGGVGDTGDALVAYDIRYTDENTTEPKLGDFIGDATLLLVVDLDPGSASIPLFSTDKQVVRSNQIERNEERARIGMSLNGSRQLVFETLHKTADPALQSAVIAGSPSELTTQSTAVIGVRVKSDTDPDLVTVEAIVNQHAPILFGSIGDLSDLDVKPVWTDLAIGRDIAGNYGAFVVREVMMFDRPLSDTELEDVTDYLMERYAITP